MSQPPNQSPEPCDQHLPQTKPSRISARWLWQSWQTGGYNNFSDPEMKLFTRQTNQPRPNVSDGGREE